MAQLHAELGGGGVGSRALALLIGVCSYGSLREGPLLLLSASSPPPAFMLGDDSLEKLV